MKVVFKTVDSCFDAIVGLEVIGYPDACILINGVKLFTSSISDKNPLLVVLLVYTPEIKLFFDRREESTTATISFKGVCMGHGVRARLFKPLYPHVEGVYHSLGYTCGTIESHHSSSIVFENAAPRTIFEISNNERNKEGMCFEELDVKQRVVGEQARAVAHVSMIGVLSNPLALNISALAWRSE